MKVKLSIATLLFLLALVPTHVAAQSVVPAGYTKCADQGQTCAFTGTMSVAYGSVATGTNGKFNIANYTNGVLCSFTVLGDPNPGWPKACYTKAVTTTSTTTPPTTPAPGTTSVYTQTCTLVVTPTGAPVNTCQPFILAPTPAASTDWTITIAFTYDFTNFRS